MEEAKTERNHKSTVFTTLFGDKARLLELYNAIEGTSYDDPNMININTLSNALILGQYNDISFTIDDKLVVLIEHQSSINKNMPLRALMYIGRVYEKIIAPKNVHRNSLIKIPKPEFIVLYNGKDNYPDEKILKLSDAFDISEDMREQIQLDLQVRVLNINKGRNSWISEKSENLSQYSEFMSKIREFMSQGLAQDEAVPKAISYCMENGILLNYLREHASGVINMLFHDFNLEEAKEVWFEEGKEEGKEEGIAIGEARKGEEDRSYIKNLQAQGLNSDEILAKFMQKS